MIDIDLLASVRQPRASAWARAWACLGAYSGWVITLATLVALLCVQLALGRAERRLDRALARARVIASQAARRAERRRSLQEQEARLRSSELALRSARGRARTGVAPVLALLGGALPKDVWLERLDVKQAEVTIEGRASSLSSFVAFANELSALPVFDGTTDLSEVRHVRNTAPGADGSVFTFTLQGKLRSSAFAATPLRRDRTAAPARSRRP